MLLGMSTQLPPEPGPSAPPQRLVRSRSERVVAGVCGGIGRYLGVDPVLVRIAFIVLALANGLGVIAYVVAWVAIPEERPGQQPAAAREPRREWWPARAGQVQVLGSRIETSAGVGDRRLRLDVRSGLGQVRVASAPRRAGTGPAGSTGCRWSSGSFSCSPGSCSCWTRSTCGGCAATIWCRWG